MTTRQLRASTPVSYGIDDEECEHTSTAGNSSLPCDQPPCGAGGNPEASAPERQMDHQPATEEPGSHLGTSRPVETTAGTAGSGNSRPLTDPKQILGQCSSGERTSGHGCVPGDGPGRGAELLIKTECPYLELTGNFSTVDEAERISSSSKKRKTSENEYEEDPLEMSQQKTKENYEEDKAFVLSLLPKFRRFNDEQRFEAQIEIMKVMRRVQIMPTQISL